MFFYGKTGFLIMAAAAIAVVVFWPRCDDEQNLTEAQLQNIGCPEILGSWEILFRPDYARMDHEYEYYTSHAFLHFKADEDGRLLSREEPGVIGDDAWKSAECDRSGSTLSLRSPKISVDFELYSDTELRQIGGGKMPMALRKRSGACSSW